MTSGGVADEIAEDLPDLTIEAEDGPLGTQALLDLDARLTVRPWWRVRTLRRRSSQVTSMGLVDCLWKRSVWLVMAAARPSSRSAVRRYWRDSSRLSLVRAR